MHLKVCLNIPKKESKQYRFGQNKKTLRTLKIHAEYSLSVIIRLRGSGPLQSK